MNPLRDRPLSRTGFRANQHRDIARAQFPDYLLHGADRRAVADAVGPVRVPIRSPERVFVWELMVHFSVNSSFWFGVEVSERVGQYPYSEGQQRGCQLPKSATAIDSLDVFI